MQLLLNMVNNSRTNLRKLERALEYINSTGNCCDVTLAQCHILMELSNKQPLGIQELAFRLRLNKSTISRTIEGMVKNKLVNRSVPESNRRKVNLSLTTNGKLTANRINNQNDILFSDALKQIPKSQRETFLQAFEIFSDYIELKSRNLRDTR